MILTVPVVVLVHDQRLIMLLQFLLFEGDHKQEGDYVKFILIAAIA